MATFGNPNLDPGVLVSSEAIESVLAHIFNSLLFTQLWAWSLRKPLRALKNCRTPSDTMAKLRKCLNACQNGHGPLWDAQGPLSGPSRSPWDPRGSLQASRRPVQDGPGSPKVLFWDPPEHLRDPQGPLQHPSGTHQMLLKEVASFPEACQQRIRNLNEDYFDF